MGYIPVKNCTNSNLIIFIFSEHIKQETHKSLPMGKTTDLINIGPANCLGDVGSASLLASKLIE